MARTIGRKYKNEIVRLVGEAREKGIVNVGLVSEYVKDNISSEAFDTWESAHDEINRLAEDLAWEATK